MNGSKSPTEHGAITFSVFFCSLDLTSKASIGPAGLLPELVFMVSLRMADGN